MPEGTDNAVKELIDYPSSTKTFGWAQPSLYPLNTIIRAGTPPTPSYLAFRGTGNIYVPDGSVKAYKTADIWKTVADRIFPLSEYHP